MVENALREGLALGQAPEVFREAKGLGDWQVAFDELEGGAGETLFFCNFSSPLAEASIDAADSVGGARDFCEEDGFLESGFGAQFGGVVEFARGRDDLAFASVDGVGVQRRIEETHAQAAHRFFAQHTFLRSPLEGRLAGVSDFAHILNSFGGIHKTVGSGRLWPEGPQLFTSFALIPAVNFVEVQRPLFGVALFKGEFALFDLPDEIFVEGLSPSGDSIVPICGFGHAIDAALLGDGFNVGNDGVGPDQLDASVLVFKVVEAYFDVEFAAAGDDVFTGVFVGRADDERVGFRQLLQAFDELGQLGWVVRSDGDAHDRRDGVFHVADGVRLWVVGDRSGFEDVLVDADQRARVAAGDVGQSFDFSAHHDDGARN